MSRWKPDARGRLEQAAWELFLERGYDATTVADIAERAELTERTFFRHYADKREVLFGGSDELKDGMLQALLDAPREDAPIDAVRRAVDVFGKMMHGRRAHASTRQQIIIKHADLQERGLIKRATLTAAITAALEERGVPKNEAMLAADMGMTVFYVSFERWLSDEGNARELLDFINEGFEQLRLIASGTALAAR